MIPIELHTERFTIRPYHKSDEHRYLEMVLDDISIEFMGGTKGIESEEKEIFKKIFNIYELQNDRIFWIWGIYKEDVLCGHLELKETEFTNENELEIVYMVHPNYRRIGLISEVLSLIKSQKKIWKKNIIATVDPDNILSMKILQKWGIVKKEILMVQETHKEFLKLSLS